MAIFKHSFRDIWEDVKEKSAALFFLAIVWTMFILAWLIWGHPLPVEETDGLSW